MKEKNKKVAIGIAALLSVTFGAAGAVLGVDHLPKQATAEAVTMTVDTLGNLEWNKVDGATGYNWSYAINGGTTVVVGGESVTNTANVRTALKAAADDAKAKNTDTDDTNNVSTASVAFSVTPVLADGSNGTVQTWTNTFTQYIDYGYTTTDISEYMTAEETTIQNRANVFNNLTYTKNSLFTFGVCAELYYYSSLYQIHVGGGKGESSSRYALRLSSDGAWQVKIGSGKFVTHSSSGKFIANENHYVTFAVLDTYDLDGKSIGETVLFSMSDFDTTTATMKKVEEITKTYTTEEITNATSTLASATTPYDINWKQTTENEKSVYSASMDIAMRSKGETGYLTKEDYEAETNGVYAWSRTYLFSGDQEKVISDYLSKQAGLAVDKLGNLSWNEEGGATGYQWSYTVGNTTSETFTTDTNSVNVNEALKAAAQSATTAGETKASVRFTITPVLTVGTGTPLVYDYSFTQYYGYDGTSHDIQEYLYGWETSVMNRKTYLENPVYYKNSLFTFGIRAELAVYGDGNAIYNIYLGGAQGLQSSRYSFRLRATGDTGWEAYLGDNGYVRSGRIDIPLQQDNYFAFGVFDTFDLSGTKTGETIYLAQFVYDEETESLVKAGDEVTWFYDISTITTEEETFATDITWDETVENGETVYSAPIDISVRNRFGGSKLTEDATSTVYGDKYTYIFSGDPSVKEEMSAADGLTFGVEDFYEIGKLDSAPNTIEVELMVPESFNSTTRAGVIVSNAVGGYGITLEIYNYGCPSLCFVASNGSGYRVRFGDIDLSKGYWVHLTITHDKENDKIYGYLNGKLIQEGAVYYSSDLTSAGATYFDYAEDIANAPFFLGNNYEQSRSDYFQGSIRSLAMYSDVRTAEEIAQDYLNGIDTKDSALLAAYETPNTAAGADISDLSANNQTIDYYRYDDLFFTEKQAVTDYAYSFAVVGDIQSVTQRDTIIGWTYLDGMYDWIIENKDSKNIQYVFNMGDTTERNTDKEWATAKAAISQLDGVIPYSLIRGNHDSSAQLNATFYYDAYTGQFNGFYEAGKLENSWRTFTVADTDYLMVNLDYGPTDAVLEWASDIIEAFPNHKVIITTHSYLSSRGTLSTSGIGMDYNFEGNYPPDGYDEDNNGQEIWDELVSKHGNIFLVLSGHVTAQRAVMSQLKGVHGNTVTQILVNPQNWDGNFNATGMVVMLYFKNDGTIEVEEYSTAKQAYFREENQYVINELSPVYTAHNFGEWVKNGAEETRTCEDCGHSETQIVPEDSDSALQGESKVKAFSLTLDGTIGVNFYIQLSTEHAAQIANAKLKIVCGADEQIVAFPEAITGTGGWADGLYKFTYYVAAKDIDTDISLQLMLNGEAVGEAQSYTVRDYIAIVLADVNGAYTQEHKGLVTALQDYCEAAAVCHNVENAKITDSARINAVENTVFDGYAATVEGENAPKIAITLLTESTTTLRIYVMGDTQPTITVNGNALEVKAGNGYYYADLTGIDAFSLASEQTFTINDTVTVKCSALTYGKVMDTTNTNLVNVMKALYLYSQAATEYKA